MKADELLDLKTFEELRDEAVQELRDRSFKITNFRAGRVFYTLLELAMMALNTIYILLAKVLPQAFLGNATGAWLDVVAQDRAGVFRKQPQKTQGLVRVGRADTSIKTVLAVGDVVATEEDSDGNTLRYLVLERTVLAAGIAEATVPVEAELGGAGYNVGQGQITQLATFRAGIDWVINDEDWITLEGTDLEDDEALRQRAINRRMGIAYGGNKYMYQSLAEEITGVARARVDTNHPRGEGTIDIVVIGTEGVPSQSVIDQVVANMAKSGSAIADIAVYAVQEKAVDITATLYYDPEQGSPDVIKPAGEGIISDMFAVTRVEGVQQLNMDYGVDRALLMGNLRSVSGVISIDLASPAADVRVGFKELAVPGVVDLMVVEAEM